MNFLVHAWLTFPDKDITWGNLYADSFKGSSYKSLDARKALGVKIHRQIDAFTDAHALVKDMVQDLRPIAGKMASPLVDIAFDYWLHQHLNVTKHTTTSLIDFTEEVLQSHPPKMGKMRNMLPYLIEQKWLLNYSHEEGILSAVSGIQRRVGIPFDAYIATQKLLQKKGLMAMHHEQVFKDLQQRIQPLISSGLS